MLYIKCFNSVNDSNGYEARIPFIGTVAGNEDVLYGGDERVDLPNTVEPDKDKSFLKWDGNYVVTWDIYGGKKVTKTTGASVPSQYGQSGITRCVIGNDLTTIGESVFCGCFNLSAITFGSSVTSIGYRAFSGCTNLSLTKIPSSVVSISSGVFNNTNCKFNCKVPDSLRRLDADVSYWLRDLGMKFDYLHLNKVTNINSFNGGVGDVLIVPSGTTIVGENELWRAAPYIRTIILQEGFKYTTDAATPNGVFYRYVNGGIVDIPSTYSARLLIATRSGGSFDYFILRRSNENDTTPGDSLSATYVFVYSEDTYLPDSVVSKKKIIGGSEWVNAMKSLYDEYKDKWYCRIISNSVTDDGYRYYTSDDKKHVAYSSWSDPFVDYDVFGLDRV